MANRVYNITIAMPDNDAEELMWVKAIEDNFTVLDIRKLPNSDHLVDDAAHKRLRKAYKDAQKAHYNYIQDSKKS